MHPLASVLLTVCYRNILLFSTLHAHLHVGIICMWCSLVPRLPDLFQRTGACNTENMGMAWGRSYNNITCVSV